MQGPVLEPELVVPVNSDRLGTPQMSIVEHGIYHS